MSTLQYANKYQFFPTTGFEKGFKFSSSIIIHSNIYIARITCLWKQLKFDDKNDWFVKLILVYLIIFLFKTKLASCMSGSSPGTTFYLLREIYSKYYMQKKRVCTVSNNSTPFIFRTYHWFHLYDVIFTIFTYYRTNEQWAQLYKINNMKKSHFLLYILPGI